jgi:hypothetical protein
MPFLKDDKRHFEKTGCYFGAMTYLLTNIFSKYFITSFLGQAP